MFLMGMQDSTTMPPWRTVWQSLITLNIQLLYDPTILLLGIYTREFNTYSHKNLYVYSSSIEKSPKTGNK